MYIVWETVRKYQKLALTSVETLALRNRRVTMDEERYSNSEESFPLSLQSWFWKRKNSVSPAAKCQSRTEAGVRSVIPSGSQIREDSVKIDPEPKPLTTNHSSVHLPGSIIDYSEEIQGHTSCVIKSVMIEDTCEEDEEGNSWLHKLGMNINKWSFLNSLIGWSENRPLEKGHMNISGVCSDADHKRTELQECTTKEEEPYIPYKLATLFVTKIVKDMQKMKNKHMKIIRELDNIRKENQEQTIAAIKNHYGEKISSLKSHLKAYLELMCKSNRHWQDTAKSLRERNRQLIQKNEDLLHEMRQQTAKLEEEKVWILENLCKNIDYLYTQHTLTLQELHIISLYVERICNLMNFQMKNLPQKSEKAEGEKSDVSEVVELKTEQVANEEEKPEWSMEKGYLWQAYSMLEKIQESLWKREREITELLQSERRYNKAMKPQITVLLFLKTLVKKVHTIYCDVPGAKQYISQLIRKNEDEKSDRKEAFNNAQADILSYEVLYGNEPMDDKRTQLSMKLFRNLGKAKSDLECVETEKIVLDSIQTGEIPNGIKKDCLYVALTAQKLFWWYRQRKEGGCELLLENITISNLQDLLDYMFIMCNYIITGILQKTLQHILGRQRHHSEELMQNFKMIIELSVHFSKKKEEHWKRIQEKRNKDMSLKCSRCITVMLLKRKTTRVGKEEGDCEC